MRLGKYWLSGNIEVFFDEYGIQQGYEWYKLNEDKTYGGYVINNIITGKWCFKYSINEYFL